MEATRRDPACEMRFQTLLQWTASISGSLSLLGSGYVLHDLRAKRRANDGVLSVGEQLAAVLSLFDCGASVCFALGIYGRTHGWLCTAQAFGAQFFELGSVLMRSAMQPATTRHTSCCSKAL